MAPPTMPPSSSAPHHEAADEDPEDDDFDFDRELDDIMAEANTLPSDPIYAKTWALFTNWYARRFPLESRDGVAPTEETYIKFLDSMRQLRKWAYSTVWSKASRLKNMYARHFPSTTLKNSLEGVRIRILLKS